MNCEIEFLPVGEASRAGDAIIVRYGDSTNYTLMLIDGGHSETGDQIVAHLKRFFGPNPVLQDVVLTHSDGDHACGLRAVLENVPVKNLWLHVPWLHAAATRHLFDDLRWTDEGLANAIRKEYTVIEELVDLALSKGATIQAPFQGVSIGPFQVCSPSIRVYNYLLPQFAKTPEPRQQSILIEGLWLGKEALARQIFEKVKAAVQAWTDETWDNERLKDGGITSASNESSVVLYGAFDGGERVLLTGDAGVRALTWTADYADSVGLPLQQFTFVQIPHHGSRRNVGPTVLDRIVGPKQLEGSPSRLTCFVSAPKDDASHPRKIVINAFKRRGGITIATQGSSKIHYGGYPRRQGYSAAVEMPFSSQVEEYT